MDSIAAWLVLTIAGLMGILWVISKAPVDKEPVYLTRKDTTDLIIEHNRNKRYY